MSNPTSSFGWIMPNSADLVTDLPADFAVFGQAVDTSMSDLLGGTTGQILSKASNTNMDFTWVTNDVGDITAVTAGTGITGGGTTGAVTITNDMATTITAAGDIVIGTGSGTYDNLPIGTTAQVLTADTSVSPYKVKWATPTSGGVLGSAIRTEAAAISTTSSSLVAMDTTNLRVTFTAPASGTVIILWRAYMYSVTGTNKVGILESTTTKVTGVPTGNGTADWVGANGIFKITGISAGSHTYDLAYLNTGGTAGVYGDSVQNSAMVVMAG